MARAASVAGITGITATGVTAIGEHGATGAAQIVPDHSACAELWRGRAELLAPARRYVPEFSVLEMGEVSADGVAAALQRLYEDPPHRRQLAQAAYRAAMNPDYSWDSIAARFDALFADVVACNS
jgi:D-inositol-3-phosphate glycosyltransferase